MFFFHIPKQRASQEIMDQDEGCLSDGRSEFPSFPLFLRNAVNPQGAFVRRHFFGYLLVAEAKKVTRSSATKPFKCPHLLDGFHFWLGNKWRWKSRLQKSRIKPGFWIDQIIGILIIIQEMLDAIKEYSLAELGYFLKPSELFNSLPAVQERLQKPPMSINF